LSGKVEAVVSEALPNRSSRVKLEDGRTAVCHVAGKARMDIVRLLPGDKVSVELSPFDPARGSIVGKKRA
jgi:translation initiation factor IF-1